MSSNPNNTAREPEQRREKFAVKMECLNCGQVGSATWQEIPQVSFKGPLSQLMKVSSGFYRRAVKAGRHSLETVCDACGTIVRKGSDTSPPLLGERVAMRSDSILKPEEFSSLREVATCFNESAIPQNHEARLCDLGLIHVVMGKPGITTAGMLRLANGI